MASIDLGYNLTKINDVKDIAELVLGTDEANDVCADVLTRVLRQSSGGADSAISKLVDTRSMLAARLPEIPLKFVGNASDLHVLDKSYPEFNLKSVVVRNHISHALAKQIRYLDYELVLRTYCNYSGNAQLLYAYDGTKYDMCIRDVGMSPTHHLNAGRFDVHCCNPCFGGKDVERFHANRQALCVSAARQAVKFGSLKCNAYIKSCIENDGVACCGMEGQYCNVTAPYVMFVHSTYDIELSDFVAILDKSKCNQAFVVMHFHPCIMENEAGILPVIGCRYKRYMTAGKQRIRFEFEEDTSMAYDHDWDTYLALICRPVLMSADGTQRYVVDQVRNQNSTIYLKISRSFAPLEPKYTSFRSIPFSDVEPMVVVLTWDYDILFHSETDRFVPIKFVVPKRLYDKITSFALACGPGKFTHQNLQVAAQSFNNREVISGQAVGVVNPIEPIILSKLVTAVYIYVYQTNFANSTLIQKLTEEEKDLRAYVESGNWRKFILRVLGKAPKACKAVSSLESDGVTIAYDMDKFKNTPQDWVEDEPFLKRWINSLRNIFFGSVDGKIGRTHPVFVYGGIRVLTISEDVAAMSTNCPRYFMPFFVPASDSDLQMRALAEMYAEAAAPKTESKEVCLPIVKPETMDPTSFMVEQIDGDGDCLFHSIIKGANLGISARTLRLRLADSNFLSCFKNKKEIKNILLAKPGSRDSWGTDEIAHLASAELGITIRLHPNCMVDGDTVSSSCCITYNPGMLVLVDIRHDNVHFDLLIVCGNFEPDVFHFHEYADNVPVTDKFLSLNEEFSDLGVNNSETGSFRLHADVQHISLTYDKRCYTKWFGFSSGYACILHAALENVDLANKKVLTIGAKDQSSLQYFVDSRVADTTLLYFGAHGNKQVVYRPYKSKKVGKMTGKMTLEEYFRGDEVSYETMFDLIAINPVCYSDMLQPICTDKCDTYVKDYLGNLRFLKKGGDFAVCIPFVMSKFSFVLLNILKDNFETVSLARSKILPPHNPWLMVFCHNLYGDPIEFLPSCFEDHNEVSESLLDMYDMFGESIMQHYHEAVSAIRSVKFKEANPEVLPWSVNLLLQKYAPPRTAPLSMVGGATGSFSYGLVDMVRVLGRVELVHPGNLEKLAVDLRVKLVKWAFSTTAVVYSLTLADVADAYHSCDNVQAKTILYLAYSDLKKYGHLKFDVDIKNQLYKKSVVEMTSDFLKLVVKGFDKLLCTKHFVSCVNKVVEKVIEVVPYSMTRKTLTDDSASEDLSSSYGTAREALSVLNHSAFDKLRINCMDTVVIKRDRVSKPEIHAKNFLKPLDDHVNVGRTILDAVKTSRNKPLAPVSESPETSASDSEFDMTCGGILPVSGDIIGGANSDHCFQDFSYTSNVWMQRVIDDYLRYLEEEVRCVEKECYRAYSMVQGYLVVLGSAGLKNFTMLQSQLAAYVNAFVAIDSVAIIGRESNVGRYVYAWHNNSAPKLVLVPQSDDGVQDILRKYNRVLSFDTISVFTGFDIYQKFKSYKVEHQFPKGGGLVQAAAGCGKTHSIISSCVSAVKQKKSFVVLTATKEGAVDVGRKLIARLDADKLIDDDYRAPVRTIDSHLMNFPQQSIDVLFIDEALMSHAGKLLLTIDLFSTDYVRAYGDRLQIPFINRLPNFIPKFCDPRQVFPIVDVLYISRRVPADVAAVLDPYYRDMNAALGLSRGMSSTNRNVPSMKLVRISTAKDVPKTANVKVLTFIQSDKQTLIAEGVKDVSTVHEYQGKESDHVYLIRLGLHEQSIYSELNHCVTALTRHKNLLTYMTVNTKSKDFVRDVIQKHSSDKLLDEHIQKVLVNLTGGAKETTIWEERVREGFTQQNNWVVNHCAYLSVKNLPSSVHMFKASKNEKFSFSNGVFFVPVSISYGDFKELLLKLKPCKIAVAENFFKNFSSVTAAKVLKNRGFEVLRTGDSSNVIRSEVFDAATVSGIFGQPIHTPVFSEEITTEFEVPDVVNEVTFVDHVTVIQNLINGFLPGTTFVDTSMDAWNLHYNEFEINVGNLRYNNLLSSTHVELFDNMRPKISSPAPRKQHGTTRHLLYAFAKRNANPPNILSIFSLEDQVEKMINIFDLCAPSTDFSKVDVTPQEMQKWVNNQPLSVLSNIIPEESVTNGMVLNAYDLIIKSSPKPDLTLEALDVYPAPQTILYQKKCVNAVFCTIWGIIRDRVIDGLHKKFCFFTKMRDEDLALWFEKRLPSRVRKSLYNWEIDMKKFDKSQHELVLMFEAALLKKFKVPSHLVSLWVNAHRRCSVVNRQSGLAFFVDFQRKSGDASTFFGNTLFLMVALVELFGFHEIHSGVFAGDDSYILTYRDMVLNTDNLAYKYNLEAKVFRFKWGYFCSKFLIPDHNKWYVVPDPLKRAVKLGRHDLKNPDHVEEYRISFLDNVKLYKLENVANLTARAMKERYASSFDATLAIKCMYAVTDFEAFHSLFYSLPSDVLCMDPSRPSLEL